MSPEFIAAYVAIGLTLSVWGSWGREIGVSFLLSTVVTTVMWPFLVTMGMLQGAMDQFGIHFFVAGHSYLRRRQINTWCLITIGHWGLSVIHDVPKPEDERIGY